MTEALSRVLRDESHRPAARRPADEIANLPSVGESAAVLAQALS
ncbi:hypothetical protein [Saccharothrix deserti]|nr:hypothetical protein [Saccharothrix deserti]